MTLPPPVSAFLAAARTGPVGFLTTSEQRALMRHLADANYLRFGRRAEPVASVTDHTVPVDGGEIRVRAFRPGDEEPLPAHVVLHGGAWWLGSSDEYVNDALCRHRCVNAECVVLAVDYRLAPEHKFPTALNDVQAALRWITGNASTLGVDPDVVSIGGTSAGANLAAAATLACRENGPSLVFQLLEVPFLDLTLASMRSLLASGELEPLNIDPVQLADAVRRYLHDPDQARLPLASPIHAGDLSGLPPAHIITAELDPLRDEGERYAHLLSEAGVPVTVVRVPRAIHATSFLTRTWEPAQEWQRSAATAVRCAHKNAAARGRTGSARKS